MDSEELAQRYFSAWNLRDAGAVLETFAPGGTYCDPITAGPIAGEAFRSYVEQLWSAFPDLSFEAGRVDSASDGVVCAAWTMQGTNTGSLLGLPPTGKPAFLPGLDVIQTSPDGIRSVVGYFDSATLQRQMGWQIIVQPKEFGPITMGKGTTVRRRHLADAQTLTVTEIVARDEENTVFVNELSRHVLAELIAGDAMQTFTSVVGGNRLTTVVTWASPEEMKSAMHSGPHSEAMSKFFATPGIEGAAIDVFTRLQQGKQYRRCHGCQKMVALAGSTGRCGCGEVLQAIA